MERIRVINYGGSNLRSVVKAVESVATKRQQVRVSHDPQEIAAADRIVFPGQGAIEDCINCLASEDLIGVIKESVNSKPFLGICLGLQSLLTFSEEDGGTACLDLVPGVVKRFPSSPPPAPDGTPQKVPHMGWNQVHWTRPHPLTKQIPDGSRFYFVHSYYVQPNNADCVAARTHYIIDFVSAISFKQAFATQFHPEKSAEHGLRLLQNFLSWDGAQDDSG
ncbi:MAG: imidazole glycerol phosphate synthase subunit HisH [Gammaproteobacteria bacterium]